MYNTSREFRQRWASIAIGALIVFISVGCHKESDESAKTAASSGPPPAVVVAEVVQQTVPLYRDFTARTDSYAEVDLRARVEGVLEEHLFEEGKLVKKDQVLFRIDPRSFEARLQSAEAKLLKAEADLAFALQQVSVRAASAELVQAEARLTRERKELERTTELTRQGVQTQQDLDTAVAREGAAQAEVDSRRAQLTNAQLTEAASIKQASAAVAVAKSDVTQAELDLSYCTITSPFDGLIGLVQVDVGNLVGRGEPTLLATVSALDPIRVFVGISESDYLRMAARRQANSGVERDFQMVLADGSVYPHKGRFVMADRAVDLRTGTLTLVLEFANPDQLVRPGQFARVRADVDTVENAILVPQRAVIQQQSAQVVYVVGQENKVEFRTVAVGERYGDQYIVTEGLSAGEKVIVEGQLKARPGVPVTPTDKPVTEEKKQGEAGQ